MSEYAREKQLQKKREYYRKWRAENPDKVRAANEKYWLKKAEELKAVAGIHSNTPETKKNGGTVNV